MGRKGQERLQEVQCVDKWSHWSLPQWQHGVNSPDHHATAGQIYGIKHWRVVGGGSSQVWHSSKIITILCDSGTSAVHPFVEGPLKCSQIAALKSIPAFQLAVAQQLQQRWRRKTLFLRHSTNPSDPRICCSGSKVQKTQVSNEEVQTLWPHQGHLHHYYTITALNSTEDLHSQVRKFSHTLGRSPLPRRKVQCIGGKLFHLGQASKVLLMYPWHLNTIWAAALCSRQHSFEELALAGSMWTC